ncbi:unnamed protein product, partial [Amoebophrya sp. A25]
HRAVPATPVFPASSVCLFRDDQASSWGDLSGISDRTSRSKRRSARAPPPPIHGFDFTPMEVRTFPILA